VPKFTEEKKPRLPLWIAEELGEVYFIRKDAEDDQKLLRTEFFEAATATFTPARLAQKTVVPPPDVQAQGEDSARTYAEQYNAGWNAIDVDAEVLEVTLREDPNYKPYQIVVEVEDGVTDRKGATHPGYVISRSISSGSPMLDTERLQAVDYDLYLRATVVANYDMLVALLDFGNVDTDKIDDVLNSTNLPRVPRNPDDLSAEDAEAIREFSFEGPKPTPKLLVRYAKEEEIGES
jgi:hypothetical protein